MIDSVLKGNGNSRFLKSAVPAGTSWTDALAMLQAGTFPIDFNGINTEGFQQVGTPLNKANLLKDATAAQIGLPPSTTPDGMFQALGNTGELHVWRKTIVTTKPVPAGYTLGDVKTKKDISATGSGEGYIGFYMGYSDNLAVDDNGGISLNPDNDYGEVTANSNFTYISSVIAGKFILIRSYQRPDDNSYSSLAGKIFYVPADANISMTQEYNYLYIRLSKCQDVTGYPLTPAGTTTTYPVSTNPNAYQEGDDAKEAGYTLGEVKTGTFAMATGNVQYSYASSISVSDDGTVSLVSPSSTTLSADASSRTIALSMRGKYVQATSSLTNCGVPFSSGSVVFLPADAVVSGTVDIDRYQPVTGYAAIPAGTTIEYLGKLGDKARVQVLSYVGTGTYGKDNKNQLTFSRKPRFIMVPGDAFGYAYIPKGRFYYVLEGNYATLEDLYCVWDDDTNTMTWYHPSYPYRQYNQSGTKYTFVAIY